MKKLLIATALVAGFSFAGTANAVDSTGCGFGSMIFKGQRGPVMQILAVTTNGTSASQTFGITSGTMGCDRNGTISGGTGKLISFLNGNMDQFAMDAAKGEGETITTIAGILNIEADKVGSVAKENFSDLFASEDVSGREVGERLVSLLNA